MVGTAVGSRPKLNTVSTRAVNTSADTMAVRVRNSSTRSLRATLHACRSRSAIGPPSPSPPPFRHRTTILPGDLGGAPAAAPPALNEPAASLERPHARELHALVHVVGGAH